MDNQNNILKEREEKLLEIRRKEEEAEQQERAKGLNLPYLNLTVIPIDRDNLNLIARTEAERASIIIIRREKNTLKVGVVDPKSKEAQLIIKGLKNKGFKIETIIISSSSFKKALREYDKIPAPIVRREIAGQVSIKKGGAETFSQLKNSLVELVKDDTSKLLELFLEGALSLDASDIHIEPEEKNIKIRFRIDGLLQIVGDISKENYKSLLSRIKLLSGIQINITNIPHAGRFTIKRGLFNIEIRSSVFPGAYGEYIVLRVLNPENVKLEIRDLGINKNLWDKIKKEIEKPNGIALVTGPTGSGKTTTLYAFLKYLLKPEIKIITLEDPIEYHLKGVSQSQIEPEKGHTFSKGIRSALRQDPDIILVGEIRDEETAQTALSAALTGHLVFSTLHTNDAAGAIPRFLDLNAKPKILASALNIIIAQRLVRLLCRECKAPVNLTDETLKKIKEGLSGNKEKANNLTKKTIIYKAVGCSECSEKGYKGRAGVFEVLVVDKKMEALINSAPSHQEVLELAQQSGFLGMRHDGLLKVLEGLTTIEEIERVALALE